jgi:hypothetical protein
MNTTERTEIEDDSEPLADVEVQDDEPDLEDEQDVYDIPPDYTIVSFGADYDVAGLVARLKSGEVTVPGFQRSYVWKYRQAARFIESLLIGLPVPGVFLWRDPAAQQFTVIDGQQRLRTLQFFKEGVFPPTAGKTVGKEFVMPERTSRYQRVHDRFQNRKYSTLDESDRRRLDNSIIHATIINQEKPPKDDTSMFYLFERLNTEGTPLQPQEIRVAIYQGKLIQLLFELNKNNAWRVVYGPVSPRMKDQELIARFFALFYVLEPYARPMKEFINRYISKNRHLDIQSAESLTTIFATTIEAVNSAIGRRAFRPVKALNAAAFDSVMIGIARRLQQQPSFNKKELGLAYTRLMARKDFSQLVSRATADADNVTKRLDIATTAFAEVG